MGKNRILKAYEMHQEYRNPLNHMTVMFRRKDVLRVENYQHFPLLED